MKIFLFLAVFAFFCGAGLAVREYIVAQKPTLKKAVDKAMLGVTGKYAIVVENFKTGERYAIHEHDVFDSGSLYKLWVMALTFDQIKKGKLQKDDVLSQEITVLNEKFGLGDFAEFTEGVMTMTVMQALNQMITISHNYAALLLSEKLTNSKIAQYVKDQGFLESSFGNKNERPKTTAFDAWLFYNRLYKGELVDKDASKEMLELLKKQQLNDGLPKLLSKNVVVAHKTGDIGWFKHDAGIVFAENGDYSIVILSETKAPISAQAQIAKVSEAVYQYFHAQK